MLYQGEYVILQDDDKMYQIGIVTSQQGMPAKALKVKVGDIEFNRFPEDVRLINPLFAKPEDVKAPVFIPGKKNPWYKRLFT
jgi:hypothetical protein